MLRLNSKNGKHLLVIAMLVAVFATCFNTEPVWAYTSYTTDEYSVTIDVHEDNTMSVREEINIDAVNPMHGIYRYIPLEGSAYMEIDGEAVRLNRAMKVKDAFVSGYEYETYTDSGNLVLRIGSADYYINGPQSYVITYNCVFYEDEIESKDFIYYNVIPQGWETEIARAQVTVNMPSEFDSNDVYVYVGGYGDSDENKASVSVDGNSVSIYADNLKPGEGITLQIDLPEGYFTGALSYDWMRPLMYGIILISVILAFLLWFLFGRDPRVVQTVEFYPPDGMTPAEAGYFIDGTCDKQDIVSMVIYFADKGYLSIEERAQKKEGLSGALLGKEETTFRIKKQKDYDGDKLFARTIFDGIFATGDEVELSELSGEFYDYYKAAIEELKDYFNRDDEKKVFTLGSSISRIVAVALTIVPVLSAIVFTGIMNHNDFAAFAPVICVASLAAYIIMIVAYDKRYVYSKRKRFLFYIIGIVTELVSLSATILIVSLYGDDIMACVVAFVASFIIFVFAAVMKKMSKKSARLLGKLLGFKEFIRLAEKDRIEKLVEEDPSYFYGVLPYAYVFGLSDKWAEKFEGIAMEPPEWYVGYDYNRRMFNTYLFMNAVNSCAKEFNSIVVPPASDGDGIDFGGSGGFGSGGGFSGGGFGGGGGGGW